jgi:uncharacterized BrkB/YihY/UPF0761 family membrane protein
LIGISIVVAILVWLGALQVWDIATLRHSLSNARGWLRLIAGAIVAFLALAVLYFSLLPIAPEAFSYLSIATFLTALAVEFIVGDDLRDYYARRR